jgi:hypothetical protein
MKKNLKQKSLDTVPLKKKSRYLDDQKLFPFKILLTGEKVGGFSLLGGQKPTFNGLFNGGQDLRHLEAAEVLVQSLQEVHLLLLDLPAPE